MRHPSFDSADVATAGLAIIRRRGWDGISLKSVAAELSVSPMALYRVVADAEQLRVVIADAAAEGLEPPEGYDLDETFRHWAGEAYARLKELPGIAGFLCGWWSVLPRWLDVVEALLARASASGVQGGEAVASTNAVFAYVLARTQLRESAMTKPGGPSRPISRNAKRYPYLVLNRAEYATCEADRHFAIGLDALIGGLPTAVSRHAAVHA